MARAMAPEASMAGGPGDVLLAGGALPGPLTPDGPLLPVYVGRRQAPLGWGAGSYAEGTARDTGVAGVDPDGATRDSRDGTYPFSDRAIGSVDQDWGDRQVSGGGTYLDYSPPTYLE